MKQTHMENISRHNVNQIHIWKRVKWISSLWVQHQHLWMELPLKTFPNLDFPYLSWNPNCFSCCSLQNLFSLRFTFTICLLTLLYHLSLPLPSLLCLSGSKSLVEVQTKMSVCGGLPFFLQSDSGDDIHPSTLPIWGEQGESTGPLQ